MKASYSSETATVLVMERDLTNLDHRDPIADIAESDTAAGRTL